jgi:hypothetical protein
MAGRSRSTIRSLGGPLLPPVASTVVALPTTVFAVVEGVFTVVAVVLSEDSPMRTSRPAATPNDVTRSTVEPSAAVA